MPCWRSLNDLLERPPDFPLPLERCHRALRPQGRPTDSPRDAVCFIVDFKMKEELMCRARDRETVQHGEAAVQLYQDMSPITLHQRKALRSLLDVLWTQVIQYSWRFPFALYASVASSFGPPFRSLPRGYRELTVNLFGISLR